MPGSGAGKQGAESAMSRIGGKTKFARPAVLAGFFILLSAPLPAQDRDALFRALDEFAAEHLNQVQMLSIRDGVEYCGLLGIDASGQLAATPPRRGRADSCEPPENGPAGFEVLASYHTHGSFDPDADSEVPSSDDLLADIEEGIDGYVATPGGRLWLNDLEAEVSFQLCGLGCLIADPRFHECPADSPANEYTLEDLEYRENTPAAC